VSPRRERRDRIREFESLGISRLILQGFAEVAQPGVLESIADDAAAVGLLDAPARS
jgi:hypothetical protein